MNMVFSDQGKQLAASWFGCANEPTTLQPSLDARVANTLKDLHAQAAHQQLAFMPVYLRLAWNAVRRKRATSSEEAALLRNLFLPLSPRAGTFVYQVSRSIGARLVVEFGTSLGISTIYLAAAVRDNGGGKVIGSEIEPSKVIRAREHLSRAGLADLAEIREGDALETLRNIDQPIDLLFLDGWKVEYLSVLSLLRSSLRVGSVVLADDVYRFARTLKPYVDFVRNPENGFSSMPLPIGEGIEFTVRIK